MTTPLLELEGTWEEVAAHAPELAGRRVRLVVLPKVPTDNASFRPRSGQSLLRHAGTWDGDDLQECLDAVVRSRSQVLFDAERECISSIQTIASASQSQFRVVG
jgi:hypothetical protein